MFLLEFPVLICGYWVYGDTFDFAVAPRREGDMSADFRLSINYNWVRHFYECDVSEIRKSRQNDTC